MDGKGYVLLVGEEYEDKSPVAMSLYKEQLVAFAVKEYGLNEQQEKWLREDEVTDYQQTKRNYTTWIRLTIYDVPVI